MLDDLRRHDPTPTEEEKAWIDCDPVAMGALAASAIALVAILVSAQPLAEEAASATRVAASVQAR